MESLPMGSRQHLSLVKSNSPLLLVSLILSKSACNLLTFILKSSANSKEGISVLCGGPFTNMVKNTGPRIYPWLFAFNRFHLFSLYVVLLLFVFFLAILHHFCIQIFFLVTGVQPLECTSSNRLKLISCGEAFITIPCEAGPELQFAYRWPATIQGQVVSSPRAWPACLLCTVIVLFHGCGVDFCRCGVIIS